MGSLKLALALPLAHRAALQPLAQAQPRHLGPAAHQRLVRAVPQPSGRALGLGPAARLGLGHPQAQPYFPPAHQHLVQPVRLPSDLVSQQAALPHSTLQPTLEVLLGPAARLRLGLAAPQQGLGRHRSQPCWALGSSQHSRRNSSSRMCLSPGPRLSTSCRRIPRTSCNRYSKYCADS